MYGAGTGPITLDNVRCTGFESRLLDCPHGGIGVHNCNFNEIAGVICAPNPGDPRGKSSKYDFNLLLPLALALAS